MTRGKYWYIYILYMSSSTQLGVLERLKEKEVVFVTRGSLARLLNISNANTVQKILQRLENNGLLTRLKKGLYIVSGSNTGTFEIANVTLQPSYVSFETALNYYSVLPQFPFSITCATTKKSRDFQVGKKSYEYTQISKNLYWGFEKQGGFLIATPEKALLDMVHLVTKGIRSLDFSELDLSNVNKIKLKGMIRMANQKQITAFFRRTKLYA